MGLMSWLAGQEPTVEDAVEHIERAIITLVKIETFHLDEASAKYAHTARLEAMADTHADVAEEARKQREQVSKLLATLKK